MVGVSPPENIVRVKNLEKKGIAMPEPVSDDEINLHGQEEQEDVHHHQIFGRQAAGGVDPMNHQGDDVSCYGCPKEKIVTAIQFQPGE